MKLLDFSAKQECFRELRKYNNFKLSYQLAKIIYNKLLYKKEYIIQNVKVDDLNVNVKFKQFEIIIYLNLSIKGIDNFYKNKIVFHKKLNTLKSSKKKLIRFLIEFLQTIKEKNLKFSKKCNKFIDNTNEYYDTNSECSECSICFDNTTLKSNCNHSICLKCFDKLLLIEKDKYFKCPICRKKY
tara:strand:- start:15 stop:566 length:552 start_codon:yes stop_codon:yes gene_type:complete